MTSVTIPVPPGAISVTLDFTVIPSSPKVAEFGFDVNGPTSVEDGQNVNIPLKVLDQYGQPMVIPDSAWNITASAPGIVSVSVQNSQAIVTGLKPGSVTLTSGV